MVIREISTMGLLDNHGGDLLMWRFNTRRGCPMLRAQRLCCGSENTIPLLSGPFSYFEDEPHLAAEQ